MRSNSASSDFAALKAFHFIAKSPDYARRFWQTTQGAGGSNWPGGRLEHCLCQRLAGNQHSKQSPQTSKTETAVDIGAECTSETDHCHVEFLRTREERGTIAAKGVRVSDFGNGWLGW